MICIEGRDMLMQHSVCAGSSLPKLYNSASDENSPLISLSNVIFALLYKILQRKMRDVELFG